MPISVSNPHRSGFNAAKFTFLAQVLTTTTYTEVARITVPVGVAYALGYGTMAGQDNAQGRVYMDTETSTPAEIKGAIRIDLHDSQDRVVKTLFEARSEETHTSVSDRRQQLPFPSISDVATQNMAIVVKMKADAALTPSAANCSWFMDATEFDAVL